MPIPCACAAMRCGVEAAGQGEYRGGDGIVREIEVLTDAEVTLLADRRTTRTMGTERWGRGRARQSRDRPA